MARIYRALYRKWRPRNFSDVVGQQDIVRALRAQVAADRVGHAYLFTGTRGTGKTTCAKILAKAVNCPHCVEGDPCGVCDVCKGVEDGSLLDVVEIDAASNNGVDDVRGLREDALYTPTGGKRKVYIIDEVHMLSVAAFNALLKIMEEPPAHLMFILATTEIHKVPITIRSRCQRYDFMRLEAADIAGRLLYVAGEEGIQLDAAAAETLAHLADGAMRDALSLLDTCSSMATQVDEALVRRVAGVTDKSYLFSISDAVASGDVQALIPALNDPRALALDTRRLCEELIIHYRDLMLGALAPDGALLSQSGAADRQAYAAAGRQIASSATAAAIRRLGDALERMARAGGGRIELELALFELAGAITRQAEAPTVVPLAVQQAASVQTVSTVGNAADEKLSAEKERKTDTAAAASTPQKPQPQQDAAIPVKPPVQPEAAAAVGPTPFAQWNEVVAAAAKEDMALGGFLAGSAAYRQGNRMLIQGNNMLYDYLRSNEKSHAVLKGALQAVTGEALGIGPYTPKSAAPAQDPMDILRQQGVEIREL